MAAAEAGTLLLSIGGVEFATTRSTLAQHDGFLRALAEHQERSHVPQSQRSTFVDRDATHFRHVLNYLRNSPSFPPTETELEELKNEADFYSLPGLVSLVQCRLGTAKRQCIAHQLNVLIGKMG